MKSGTELEGKSAIRPSVDVREACKGELVYRSRPWTLEIEEEPGKGCLAT